MTKQRRTFTPEFKREAASLVLDQGYSHIDAARSLGLVDCVDGLTRLEREKSILKRPPRS